MEFVVKVNGLDVPASFYEETDTGTSRWAIRTRIDDKRHVRRDDVRPATCTTAWLADVASARRHRHGRRQPVGRGGACEPAFENIYALPRLHALFRAHGVRPTYVITYPVATDARSADVLRALQAGGDCEIGAHHHAWETPPCTEEDVRRHPYASTLAARQFEAQLEALTTAIAAAVGRAPVSYRSGRFGFSADHVAAPRAAAATWSSRASRRCSTSRTKADRNSSRRRCAPYFLAYDSATRPGSSRVLEVPVSAALNRRLPRPLQYAYARAPKPYTTKRVLRALRLLRLRWLRPSYSSLEDMIGLARDLARRKSRCSTCSSTRARRSSAAARTTARRRNSTRFWIGWIASWRSRRASFGATPADLRRISRRPTPE